MALLFRLPFLLIELLLRRLFGGGEDRDVIVPTATPPRAPAEPPGAGPVFMSPRPPMPRRPPAPSAEEAIERRLTREAAAPPPPPPPPPAPILRAVGDDGHIDRGAEVVESVGPAADVSGTLTVEEPWNGYDGMGAPTVVRRLRDADMATKAIVRLYERQHKQRATVLRATG
jgi:hypothetical protein